MTDAITIALNKLQLWSGNVRKTKGGKYHVIAGHRPVGGSEAAIREY